MPVGNVPSQVNISTAQKELPGKCLRIATEFRTQICNETQKETINHKLIVVNV